MEQHPIPRQITTFEFKLIGFLTLKQFIYLIIFAPLGFIVYRVFPVPLLNVVVGGAVAAIGAAFAFVPINDRPLDVWIRNLVRRVTSPTQYMYHKQNPPIYFLENLYFAQDPHRVLTHIESREKLTAYLAKTNPQPSQNKRKQLISDILKEQLSQFITKKTKSPVAKSAQAQPVPPVVVEAAAGQTTATASIGKPTFFSGVVKNHKLIPLPGILVYVRDPKGNTIRLLKTNPHGVFATYNPLGVGEYFFEPKDPRKTYFFDTMKFMVDNTNQKPIEIFSKELL